MTPIGYDNDGMIIDSGKVKDVYTDTGLNNVVPRIVRTYDPEPFMIVTSVKVDSTFQPSRIIV